MYALCETSEQRLMHAIRTLGSTRMLLPQGQGIEVVTTWLSHSIRVRIIHRDQYGIPQTIYKDEGHPAEMRLAAIRAVEQALAKEGV